MKFLVELILDKLKSITGLGLVSDVFRDLAHLNSLPGQATIGHIRCSTSGGDTQLCNVPPFLVGHQFGQLAVAHNGNLVNYLPPLHKLEAQGSFFNNSLDMEVILHLITTSSTTWMHGVSASFPNYFLLWFIFTVILCSYLFHSVLPRFHESLCMLNARDGGFE